MANQEHLELLLRGIDEWNAWRRRNPGIKPDLSEARLVNVDLERAILDGADLSRADLSKAQLSHSSLNRANLESATLILADLLGAVLNEANLSGASFFGAFLFGTHLKSVNLKGANLLGASLMGADLTNADLSGAHLMSTNFHEANLSGSTLHQTDLTAASLIGTRLDGTRFDSCWVHGLSAWRLEGTPAEQSRLIITPRKEPAVWVDDLEAAQLVSLQVFARNPAVKKSVCVASRMVVALGRFRGRQLEAAKAVSRVAAGQQFLPVVSELDQGVAGGGAQRAQPLIQSARLVVLDLTGIRQGQRVLEQVMSAGSDIPILVVWEADQSEPETLRIQSANVLGREPYRDSAHLESVLLGCLKAASGD